MPGAGSGIGTSSSTRGLPNSRTTAARIVLAMTNTFRLNRESAAWDLDWVLCSAAYARNAIDQRKRPSGFPKGRFLFLVWHRILVFPEKFRLQAITDIIGHRLWQTVCWMARLPRYGVWTSVGKNQKRQLSHHSLDRISSFSYPSDYTTRVVKIHAPHVRCTDAIGSRNVHIRCSSTFLGAHWTSKFIFEVQWAQSAKPDGGAAASVFPSLA